jgi:hypothetical protein
MAINFPDRNAIKHPEHAQVSSVTKIDGKQVPFDQGD